MKKLTLIFLLAFIFSCSSNMTLDESYSFEVVKRMATEQWEKYEGTEEYEKFKNDWLSFNNANRIDEKGFCYLLSGDTEILILIQNRNGTLQNVISENDNDKTRCFRKAFLGVSYPKPPFSPFYHYMIMIGHDA